MFGMIRKNLNTISIFARRTMSHRDSKPNISGLLEKQKKRFDLQGKKQEEQPATLKVVALSTNQNMILAMPDVEKKR